MSRRNATNSTFGAICVAIAAACSSEPEQSTALYTTALEAVLASPRADSGVLLVHPRLLRKLHIHEGLDSGYDPNELDSASSDALARAVAALPRARLCNVPQQTLNCGIEAGEQYVVFTMMEEPIKDSVIVSIALVEQLSAYTGVGYFDIPLRRDGGKWVADPLIYRGDDN